LCFKYWKDSNIMPGMYKQVHVGSINNRHFWDGETSIDQFLGKSSQTIFVYDSMHSNRK